MRFTIYYSDRVVTGKSVGDWKKCQDDDIQVLVIHEPPPNPLPDREITGYVACGLKDCTMYTGVDEYDPFDCGHVKHGALLSDEDYFAIWESAYNDQVA